MAEIEKLPTIHEIIIDQLRDRLGRAERTLDFYADPKNFSTECLEKDSIEGWNALGYRARYYFHKLPK